MVTVIICIFLIVFLVAGIYTQQVTSYEYQRIKLAKKSVSTYFCLYANLHKKLFYSMDHVEFLLSISRFKRLKWKIKTKIIETEFIGFKILYLISDLFPILGFSITLLIHKYVNKLVEQSWKLRARFNTASEVILEYIGDEGIEYLNISNFVNIDSRLTDLTSLFILNMKSAVANRMEKIYNQFTNLSNFPNGTLIENFNDSCDEEIERFDKISVQIVEKMNEIKLDIIEGAKSSDQDESKMMMEKYEECKDYLRMIGSHQNGFDLEFLNSFDNPTILRIC